MSILSVVLIVVLVSAAWYKSQQEKTQEVLLRLEADRNCDLQKSACTLKWSDGVVSLSITPRPVPLVKPINISVQLERLKVEAIAVDFKGTTMNMGPNNVKLANTQNGRWTGTGMLPVCIRNQMEWQADVYLQTDKGIIIAPFIFVTHKHY